MQRRRVRGATNQVSRDLCLGITQPLAARLRPEGRGTSFYINDVGLSKWEIDVGANGADYGWNVREALATRIRTPTAVQPRRARPIPSMRTRTTGCASIIGGIFAPVGKWTPDVDGAYLFGDLVCGKIFKLTPAGGGTYTTTEFATPIGTNWLISMIVGPHAGNDAIYYITWNDGNSAHEVRRIAFTGQANRSPVARATANPTHGALPLNVSDGTTSFDPDGDPLTYEWDFGDGSAHQTTATATHTYTTAGTFTASLTVRDNRGGEGHDNNPDRHGQRRSGPADRHALPHQALPCGRDHFASGPGHRPRGWDALIAP